MQRYSLKVGLVNLAVDGHGFRCFNRGYRQNGLWSVKGKVWGSGRGYESFRAKNAKDS